MTFTPSDILAHFSCPRWRFPNPGHSWVDAWLETGGRGEIDLSELPSRPRPDYPWRDWIYLKDVTWTSPPMDIAA